ncbi:hypothetical protein MNEG_0655 [Monoraphidium neglectum]|uniref:C2H2-type domain-containing protein n=1 Tax=Monoraphidium neglectum TaxID=145388 RepID=A0A0D2NSX7_9CHLO|nr:hypothetical protein MNEG_0655 [Monoraphidium neglectum]KIZ07311.1 hypothetical protein MNEG_0655 [Monoraphidium neglectum]|eukprot:XP_013906330.1 hypothetical protein MNEG_0655 [Monoraphidium neglectum]
MPLHTALGIGRKPGSAGTEASSVLAPCHVPRFISKPAVAARAAAGSTATAASAGRRIRGAGYYERYLRNRRKRGGEFLDDDGVGIEGPAAPLPPGAWLPHLSDEPPPPGVSAAALAFGNAAGGAVAAPGRWPAHAALLRGVVREAVAAYRLAPPPEVQRPRDAVDRLRDRVPEDQASGLLAGLARADGLIIGPPNLQQQRNPDVQLPRLLRVEEACAHGEAVEVYAFWDVSSLHPRALDPRVVVHRMRRVLAAAGEVRGLYAYCARRQLSWVPEAFMRLHAPERLQGGPRARVPSHQQQQQLQQQQPAEAAADLKSTADDGGGSSGGGEGALEPAVKLRCPVCGQGSRSYDMLRRHMGQVHKQRAPPLAELERAMSAQLQGPAPAKPPGAAQDVAAAEAIAAMWRGGLTNTGGRTLGKVAAYTSSSGALFTPRPGLQISLRYVLAREGADVRIVQNQREAVDESLTQGLAVLLDRLERRHGNDVSTSHVVVAIASDSRAHAPLLQRARQLGCSILAICNAQAHCPEADALLRWRVLSAGRYIV